MQRARRMCSQNQRVRPDCRRNCCGDAGVQRELETHDAKEKGEGSWWSHGAQQHDEKQCEKSAYGKQCGFQGWRPRCNWRHLWRRQDQAQVFSRYPAAVLVNCRWSRRAQQHDGKQCVKSACSKQCGFQGWRPRCSCGIYGGTRIRPRSSRGIRLLELSS